MTWQRNCFACMKSYDSPEVINVGTGEDVTIKELAETVADVVGFRGEMNGILLNQMELLEKF